VGEEGMDLFVYGTLRKGMANSRLMRGARLVAEKAWTQGELYDTEQGYPAMIRGSGTVIGEVYRIDENLLVSIDELEDYYGPGDPDNLYERVVQTVCTESGFLAAYVYLYSRPEELRSRCPRIFSGDWNKYIQKK
jgi:gamma-glutamylcyclotransferase (GGCT)/AIG2-like uncharacterized protein YtfP